MKQLTLAAVGFERYAKTTRRAAFLAEMERVVPWSALCALIEPFYPKPGNGRPPVGVERMLRIYFLQQWFNLSDPAVEEALYDSSATRRFVDIDLGREPVPDETTPVSVNVWVPAAGVPQKGSEVPPPPVMAVLSWRKYQPPKESGHTLPSIST